MVITSNDNTQLAPAASVAPDMDSEVPPDVATMLGLPAQVLLAFGGLARTNALAPVCMAGLSAKLVKGTAPELENVMDRREVPPRAVLLGLKAAEAVSALEAEAVTLAVL